MVELGLSPQDIFSLQRVAGYFDGKREVGIQEFIRKLNNRPKVREEKEQRLFQKIISTVKGKGLGFEQLFKLLDLNSDNQLNHAELKTGLNRLHMPFSEKDLNSIFQILDDDKSGTIQLTEFLDKLEMYEKMEPLPMEADYIQKLTREDILYTKSLMKSTKPKNGLPLKQST